MAIFDFVDASENEYLTEYVRDKEKQPRSTTGLISITANDVRTLYDVHAAFIDNSIESGDTIEILQTTPVATSPATGFFYVTEIIDNHTISISGKLKTHGTHIAYRIIETGGIQKKINNLYNQYASLLNVDIESAVFYENINKPWYNIVTSLLTETTPTSYSITGYFGERGALDDSLYTSPVLESDIVEATAVPAINTTLPGPLLFPFTYSLTNPDRRSGSASLGLGTPALLGIPDTAPRVPIAFNPPSDISIQLDLGEKPTIVDEENFYSTATQDPSPPPYYSGDEATRLNSYKSTLTNVLGRQISAINSNMALLDQEILNMQTRGVTSSEMYAVISVARLRLNTALANATFHLTDPTVGVPSIDVNTDPATHPRRVYITGQRLSEIDNRITEIAEDQDPWVNERYSFLARRINKQDGSLLLLNRSNYRIVDIIDRINVLSQEKQDIKNVLNGGK
jgi:hypothetical protein